jgi:hypothetical protein
MRTPFFFIRLPLRWHWNIHRGDYCVLCISVPGLGFRWHK